jgi:hypothetical protein
MKCESCGNIHDGNYGSGRFCSKKCASSFSTKSKREEINKKVSIKLKGKKSHNEGFKKGHDSRRKIFTIIDRQKAIEVRRKKNQILYEEGNFETFSWFLKKRKIKEDQNYACFTCGLNEWNKLPIKLEVHHIDDKLGDKRDNLIALCPNCHSQTLTWRQSWKNKKNHK